MGTELNARFSIVTPMFLGGASPNELADTIRPPSVKGALRFWWRAANWARVLKEAKADVKAALARLYIEEGTLFGHAAEEYKPYGQSRMLLRTQLRNATKQLPERPQEGHKYLLGQGLCNAQRTQAWVNGTLELGIRFRPDVTLTQRTTLLKALAAWGVLGGLGSRSRRGIGSIAIKDINSAEVPIPLNTEDMKTTFEWLELPACCGLPPFSAFSETSRIDCSLTGDDAWTLLNDVGIALMRYRGWGYHNPITGRHEVAGELAEQNFCDDHHWMLDAAQGICPPSPPRRAVFGLPHNYFFKSEFDALKTQWKEHLIEKGISEQDADKKATRWARDNAKADVAPSSKGRTRRASPLFIHVHRFPDGKAAVIETLLPAAFLPPGDQVAISAKRLTGGGTLPMTPDWQVITDYLDRFSSKIRLV